MMRLKVNEMPPVPQASIWNNPVSGWPLSAIVAVMILGTSATPEDLTALRTRLGLDRPAPLRYLDWIGGTLRGDWGTSLLYQVPVRPLSAHDRSDD